MSHVNLCWGCFFKCLAVPIEEDEIVVSYDVTALFTEIPLDETINHIIDQIYNQ